MSVSVRFDRGHNSDLTVALVVHAVAAIVEGPAVAAVVVYVVVQRIVC